MFVYIGKWAKSYLIGNSISPSGLSVSSISSSAFDRASSNDIFGRFLNSLTLSGCELSSAPIIVIPLSLILPVNGILNSSSSSASLSTNWLKIESEKICQLDFCKIYHWIWMQMFTLSKFKRSSYGLKMNLDDPSTASFKHSKLSISIFVYKLYWMPISFK